MEGVEAVEVITLRDELRFIKIGVENDDEEEEEEEDEEEDEDEEEEDLRVLYKMYNTMAR